jgi:predicted MFS family arabinose efflux permease
MDTKVVSLRHLIALFGIPKARLGLLAMLLVVTGQFGTYTYMGAFLEQVTLTPPAILSSLLLGYGIAGFMGNFVGGAAAQRNARWTMTGISFLLGGAIILLPLIGRLEAPAAILILLWGFAFGALPIAIQGWMLKAAPDEMESASAMFISSLQIGLASGSFLGGVVVDRFGLDATLLSSGCIALMTAGLLWIFGRDGGSLLSQRLGPE